MWVSENVHYSQNAGFGTGVICDGKNKEENVPNNLNLFYENLLRMIAGHIAIRSEDVSSTLKESWLWTVPYSLRILSKPDEQGHFEQNSNFI